MDSLPPLAAAPQMKRQIARQDSHDRHVDDVGAQRQDAAVLEHQRLDGQDGGQSPRWPPRGPACRPAARRPPGGRMVPIPTGKLIIWAANTNAPITPAGGCWRRRTRAARAAPCSPRRGRRRVQGGPHRRGEKSVGDMHVRLTVSRIGIVSRGRHETRAITAEPLRGGAKRLRPSGEPRLARSDSAVIICCTHGSNSAESAWRSIRSCWKSSTA